MEGEMPTEQPKRRRKSLLIWFIVLLIVGVLILIVLTNCTVKNIIGLGLKCHLKKAISENNVTICNKLSIDSQISTCYIKYAIEKKDTSVCEDIPNRLATMACYKGVAQVAENRITLCNALPGGVEKPNCYTAFLQVKDTIEECNLLSGSNKDLCYRFFATIKNDFQWCDSIVDVSEKSTCERDAYLSTISKETPCADSDNGITQTIKGWVMDNVENVVYEDQCLGTSLIEHYCENNRHQQKEIPCSCNEGVCS